MRMLGQVSARRNGVHGPAQTIPGSLLVIISSGRITAPSASGRWTAYAAGSR